ncbi:hypothetical protein OS493_021597 [Desmophyllum pertusum]|uniref:Uncharacterized protein n=1 Tax=Desmophyllum pertusum TaxID=174260 RepID=A0A9W9YQU4_9CNID|nr:hypothetical protein OS493_021597 [Desmophyllum pertusum]
MKNDYLTDTVDELPTSESDMPTNADAEADQPPALKPQPPNLPTLAQTKNRAPTKPVNANYSNTKRN